MRKTLLATAALLPAVAAATALPAGASTATGNFTVHASSVATQVAPGAAPLRPLRSSTQSCSGTLAYKQMLVAKGTVLGELDIYTKPTNGGTVVACFRHAGATKGLRLPTAVSLGAAKSMTAKKPAVLVVASGKFISYAGPAAVGGVKGNCVAAGGAVVYHGTAYAVTSKPLCGS